MLSSRAALLAGTPLLAGALLLTTAPASSGQQAVADSLPAVSSGARPGPDVLYEPAPAAPQLENRDPRFRAPMLRVAATEAYAAGEFLHSDYLYDDYGADTDGQRGGSLSERAGDIDYPAEEQYGGNAADIVEVRIAPGPDDVLYRVTLNSLLAEDVPIVALAYDTDGDAATGQETLPRDPGSPFPGTDEVITVWGTGGEHSSLPTAGGATTTPVEVDVDLASNQLTFSVPRSVSDPSGTWALTAVAGVNEPGTPGQWRQPGGETGVMNVAFRYDEPIQSANVPPDAQQSGVLADGSPTAFARGIDFDALTAGERSTTVPETGRQIRMFPSRLQLGEGRDLSAFPQYRGQLQPYAVYLPEEVAAGPVPLTLSLHSLGQQYWQYQGGQLFAQQGEDRGNAVLSPMGRGPDGWYQREAEYDVFEAWNDLARHVALDPDRAYVSGYSMGGYGTYRLGGLYPDLFARAFTVVGPPGDGIWVPPAPPTGGAETLSNLWLENVRNIPYMNLVATEDELVPIVGPRAQNLGATEQGVRGFEQLGYRYRFLVFPAAEHFTLAVLGYDFPAARDHLGDAVVDRDPAHVTFAYMPGSDAPELGLVHDHAYWVSDVVPADTATPTSKGVVDARSRAFGVADPETQRTQGAGVMQLPYTEVGLEWLDPAAAPVENVLDLALTNVTSATLDVDRARLDEQRPLTVEATSDAAAALRLTGAFAPGTTVTSGGQPVASTRGADGALTFSVAEGTGSYLITPPASAAAPGAATPPPASAPARTARSATLPATGTSGLLPVAALCALAGGAVLRRRRHAAI